MRVTIKIHTLMFTVIKRMEISASHKLVLPYRSKCASLHGHNWIITVYCRSARLNSEGMMVEFLRDHFFDAGEIYHHSFGVEPRGTAIDGDNPVVTV